jgi:hypothetical protein
MPDRKEKRKVYVDKAKEEKLAMPEQGPALHFLGETGGQRERKRCIQQSKKSKPKEKITPPPYAARQMQQTHNPSHVCAENSPLT